MSNHSRPWEHLSVMKYTKLKVWLPAFPILDSNVMTQERVQFMKELQPKTPEKQVSKLQECFICDNKLVSEVWELEYVLQSHDVTLE